MWIKSDKSTTFLILWKIFGFQVDVDRRKFPARVREDRSHRERSHCTSPLGTFVSMLQYWYLWVSVCFLCIMHVSFTEWWTVNSSVEISVCQPCDSLLDPSVLLISIYRDSSYPPSNLCNKGWVLTSVRLETRANINSKLHTCPSQDVWTGWEKSFIVYRMSWYCLCLTVIDWRIHLGQGLPTGPACYKCLPPCEP